MVRILLFFGMPNRGPGYRKHLGISAGGLQQVIGLEERGVLFVRIRQLIPNLAELLFLVRILVNRRSKSAFLIALSIHQLGIPQSRFETGVGFIAVLAFIQIILRDT